MNLHLPMLLGGGTTPRVIHTWAVLRDEQNEQPVCSFSLLNDKQMSNKGGVEHQPNT